MRIGILSDTHNQLQRTRQAMQLLLGRGAEAIIHCGDYTSGEIVTACAAPLCYFAWGNNDADNVPELIDAVEQIGGVRLDWGAEITLAGRRIAVTHGHMHTDTRRLLAAEPDYLLSGHSHLAADQRVGPTRRINPGALHRAKIYTVAMLDLSSDALEFIELPKDRAARVN